MKRRGTSPCFFTHHSSLVTGVAMATIDLNDERMFELVTEALRAGPGSPQWHQAVTLLRESGESGEDYAVLLAAREHLESGREYRAVKAGPKFTRKVMEEIDKEAA